MFNLIAKQTASAKDDVLSGLTVALALVPEAVAFAFVAGVPPLAGLYAAFIIGLVTATFGGRPGMISGATGAIAVVIISLVAEHGVAYLFPTVVLMGLIQICCGALKLGRFVRLIPYPVMLGFVNGLAIVIFWAQRSSFQTVDGSWMQGSTLWIMLGLAALTMLIIHFLPKFTKAIPSTLAGILVVSLLVIFTGLDTVTVGDKADIKGSLPSLISFEVPLTFETLSIIFPVAFVMAMVGLIESLMTLQLIDEITETRGRGNVECVAQGASNVITGFFGGMGGCAMIGQSMINIRSGGRGRLSGISAALFLLCFILFVSDYIEMIPIAALTGVMFMVVIGTFEWSSFRIMGKIPFKDALVLIAVSAITVVTDNLALAVFVGVIISALAFAWENARHIRIEVKNTKDGAKEYDLHGPLFFGSVQHFQDIFKPSEDPEHVIVDFIHSRVWDHSGLEAINSLAERYQKAGKNLHLRHLSPECRSLLSKAGPLVEVNVLEDPHYNIANLGKK